MSQFNVLLESEGVFELRLSRVFRGNQQLQLARAAHILLPFST